MVILGFLYVTGLEGMWLGTNEHEQEKLVTIDKGDQISVMLNGLD